MPNNGTSSAHFLVEFDGVSSLEASEVSGINKKHEPVEIMTGNRSMPIYARGKSKMEPVTLKHAMALNASGRELFDYFDNYTSGIVVEKRNLRVVQLGEDGFSTVAVTDLIDCVPTEFMIEGNKADSKDAAYFTVKLQPSDVIIVTEG